MHAATLPLLIRQLRTQNAVPPVAALTAGYAYLAGSGQDGRELYAAAIALICCMFFATLQNDSADYALDNAGKRQAPLNQGLLQPSVLRGARVLLLIAAACLVAATHNPVVTALFVTFMLLVWAYNRPPLQLSYHPVLSIASLGLLLSTLPFAIGLMLAERSTRSVAAACLLGLGLLIHRMSVSCLKDYKDYAEDRQFNKQTFLIHFGGTATKQLSIAGSLVGTATVLAILWSQHTTPYVYLPLTALAGVAGNMYIDRMRLGIHHGSYRANGRVFQRIFVASLYFDLLVAACLYTS